MQGRFPPLADFFTAGKVQFQISLTVYPEDMKHWSPERIKRFFDGLAQAREAMNESSPEATP